jgi:hypothetical protein
VPDMSERLKKAFDFAADAAKQLITVSTAVIAFSAVLVKDFMATPAPWQKVVFGLFLFGYMISIILGLLGIFAMAGELEAPEGSATPSIFHGKIDGYLKWQMILFAVATFLVVLFGISAVIQAGQTAVGGVSTISPTAPAGVSPEPKIPTPSPPITPTAATKSKRVPSAATPSESILTPLGGTPLVTAAA